MATTSSTQINPLYGQILTPVQVLDSLDRSIAIAQEKGDLNLYESHMTEVVEHGIQVRVASYV